MLIKQDSRRRRIACMPPFLKHSLNILMQTITRVYWRLEFGKIELALPFFKTALEANPSNRTILV